MYYSPRQECCGYDNIDKMYKDLNEIKIVILDSDVNAGINIIFEGLKLYIKDVIKILNKSKISLR